MERRDFLKSSTAAVLGAGAAAGCATVPTPGHETQDLDPEAMEATLRKIDARMEALLETSPPGAPAGLPPEAARALEGRVQLTRKALRTFYMLGALTEMEERDRVHPGVQLRLRRMQREMDEAVLGVTEYLETLSEEEKRGVQDLLKKDPGLPAQVSELIQATAAEDGFTLKRRVDLRLAFDDLGRRLRSQNPSLLIDRYTRKVRQIQARPDIGSERELRSRMGEQAFLEYRQRLVSWAAAWDRVYSTRDRLYVQGIESAYPEAPEQPPPQQTPSPPPPPAAPQQAPAPDGSGATAAAEAVLRVGGITLGLGVILELIGLLSGSTGAGSTLFLILGVTVGPIVIGIGLLMLIIGGIWYLAAVAASQ